MAESTETPSPTPSPTPKSESKPEVKPESKKQDKKPEVKPIYPKYQGYSCPVCGSKRVTDDSGKYICPVTPKPSDCPVQ